MAEEQSTATFREIQGFPGYRVGDDGSVWSCRERVYPEGQFGAGVRYRYGLVWRRLKARPTGDYGYLDVQLYGDGRSYHRLVHRLVLFAFVGNPPPGHEAFHKNNDPSDNRLSNLRWGTKSENQQHRRRCERERGHADVRRRKRPPSADPRKPR